jgi:uncharacterized protein (UPF0261 family)
MMPSVADIAGLNVLTRRILANAAGAIVGMVETGEIEPSEKPAVVMSMLGSTSRCGLEVKSRLEDKGYEVVVFHSLGIGGKALEDFVRSNPVTGLIELGLNELGSELFGGLASAGPNRLEAAGEKGILQIVTPGAAEILNFTTPETVPPKYRKRLIHVHNPSRNHGGEIEPVNRANRGYPSYTRFFID